MFFDFLFKKRRPAEPHAAQNVQLTPQPASAPAGAEAPGTHIAYHPDLISQLQGDHKKLLGIFGNIQNTFNTGDLAGTAIVLEEFRSAIQGHLLTENIKLYIYLEHALSEDDGSRHLVHDFRHEMDGIGKIVLAFLSKYKAIASHPELASTFGLELDQIGAALIARIKREEETLYPLYLPAY